MTITTIKVDRDIRDRLAALARKRAATMGALLASVVTRLEDEQRWLDIESGYERLREADPDGWQDYLAELRGWDAGTAEQDAAAADEWPEYNQGLAG